VSDLLSRLSLQPVDSSDFEAMLALRIDAMRPSLERVGRFDAARSRERLTAGFVVPFMHHIVLDGDQRVGFVTLKPEGATMRCGWTTSTCAPASRAWASANGS
jgi:hypothetical protein